MKYWVVGGVYTGTSFSTIAGGHGEERHGPFTTYQDALEEWHARAWATVDDCNARYRIEKDNDA